MTLTPHYACHSPTRHTKALDAIKTIRKEMAIEAKLDAQLLEHLQMNKEKAQKVGSAERQCSSSLFDALSRSCVFYYIQVKTSLVSVEAAITSKTDKIEQLKAEIDEVTNAHAELMDKSRKHQQIESQIDAAKSERRMLLKQRDDLKSTLDEMEGMASSIWLRMHVHHDDNHYPIRRER